MEGLQLANGRVTTGTGGGLCQMANLLFWLALHTPLEIRERHHHSFDLFPDDRRVIPFGSGTSVAYNYVDLRLYNPTEFTFQYRLWLSEEFLEGTIHTDRALAFRYRIEERNHRFYEEKGRSYRENEIWRLTLDPQNGDLLSSTLLLRNKAEVRYQVSAAAGAG
ncbi:VanW family protein [Paenibacillus sp. CC-CFT747]|nr:VanW family protein [Paenibacillus sp. CC-CFT747]